MNRNGMGLSTDVLAAMGIGALLMYVLDPQQGRRRIAIARDKAVHLARTGSDMAGVGARDLAHRVTGVGALVRRAVRGNASTDDAVLTERIRARLGRLVSHPGAIKVVAAAGEVTLSGAVLKNEQERVLRGVRQVPGVRRVANRLDSYERTDHVRELQGAARPLKSRLDLVQRHWAPGNRLLALAAGTALAGYGARGHGAHAALLGIFGIGLVARAAMNGKAATMPGTQAAKTSSDTARPKLQAAPARSAEPGWP